MNNPAPTDSTIPTTGLFNLKFAVTTLIAVVCFTGCDLGTYNKRLNDRTPSPSVRPEKTMDDAESSVKTDN